MDESVSAALGELNLPVSLPGEEVQPRVEGEGGWFSMGLGLYDPWGRPIPGDERAQSRMAFHIYKPDPRFRWHASLWWRDIPVEVSTVYLGIDHSHGHYPMPIIFETMIFAGLSSLDEACWRYATPAAAAAGHARVVEALKAIGFVEIDEKTP